MNNKKIKEFLSLFMYADDDKKKSESINYILSQLQLAEETNKTQQFTMLKDVEYLPNPVVDRSGELLFNTKTFIRMYEEYCEKVRYVKSEVANLVRENYVIMRDIVKKPLNNTGEIDEN